MGIDMEYGFLIRSRTYDYELIWFEFQIHRKLINKIIEITTLKIYEYHQEKDKIMEIYNQN